MALKESHLSNAEIKIDDTIETLNLISRRINEGNLNKTDLEVALKNSIDLLERAKFYIDLC